MKLKKCYKCGKTKVAVKELSDNELGDYVKIEMTQITYGKYKGEFRCHDCSVRSYTMRHHFEKDEMDFSTGKPICPDCKNHKQGDSMKVHDCKKLYVTKRDKDGKITEQGQCCCYSEEHGVKK